MPWGEPLKLTEHVKHISQCKQMKRVGSSGSLKTCLLGFRNYDWVQRKAQGSQPYI
jgi:hypothetical protein